MAWEHQTWPFDPEMLKQLSTSFSWHNVPLSSTRLPSDLLFEISMYHLISQDSLRDHYLPFPVQLSYLLFT